MERLPIDLRVRIFRLAGLPEAEKIYLDPTKFWTQWPEPEAVRAGLRTALALSLVCRSVSKDALSSFYRDNSFILRTTRPQDLELMRHFRPCTIRAFARLTIHLNTTSCIVPDRLAHLCEWADNLHTARGVQLIRDVNRGNPMLPLAVPLPSILSIRNLDHEKLLSAWSETMDPFMHNVSSGIDLSISCDCEDLDTAEAAVKPFGALTCAIDSCAIRLARSPDALLLRNLARQTALAAMQRSEDKVQRLSFSDLPTEVQVQILGHTDLILPAREVQWTPRKGFRVYLPQYCGRFRCNGGNELTHVCRHHQCFYRTGGACFCQRYHASWSTKCRCWVPPTALFLVSRAFRAVSQSVFYGQNCFLVAPISAENEELVAGDRDAFMESFCKNVVGRTALQDLRVLNIACPTVLSSTAQCSWLESWRNGIDHLKDHLFLSRLTLSLDLKSFHYRSDSRDAPGSDIRPFYQKLVQPLKEMAPFGRFFLYLPLSVLDLLSPRPRGYRNWVMTAIATLEQQMEKEVQGFDYDSIAMGKALHWQKHWMGWQIDEYDQVGEAPYELMPEWWRLHGESIDQEDYFTKLGPFNRSKH